MKRSDGEFTPQMKGFASANKKFWQTQAGLKRPTGGYVLVPVAHHPVIRLSDASFASIAARARGLKILFWVDPRMKAYRRLLASYPNAEFACISGLRAWRMKHKAKQQARVLFDSVRTPQDLLGLNIDGIKMGDVIYDAVLARGYATIDKIDDRVLRVLESFCVQRGILLDLMDRFPLQLAVLAHIIGMQGSLICRYLLHRNIEVISRSGGHQIALKKYKNAADIGYYPTRPEQIYFDRMMKSPGKEALSQAREYLEKRFQNQVRHPALDLAFDPEKKVYTQKDVFCDAHGLNPAKPLVFVMLHAFSDYPHSSFAKPMLFQDYYDWMIRTLAIAKSATHVNWVFKEHPASFYYPLKDFKSEDFFSTVNNDNILFLDYNADFNSCSLRYLAHAVVTCIGSAGLEYAACGIPCVLGGQSGYDGFGFTYEPQSTGEYEQLVANIDRLGPLDDEQAKAASMVAYFFFHVIQSAEYEFCPFVDDKETVEWDGHKEGAFWREAARRFTAPECLSRMKKQSAELARFVSDPEWTQYVDVAQTDFLKPASVEQQHVRPVV